MSDLHCWLNENLRAVRGAGRLRPHAVGLLIKILQSRTERERPVAIRLQLIGTLFGRASNVLMVALAAFICGSAAYVRGGWWLTGAIAAGEVALLIIRSGIIVEFKRRRALGRPSDPDFWLVAFGVLAIGSSVSWGALCFVCLAYSHDPVLYVVPVLSTVGTAGAVAARNSGVPRLAQIQLACSLLPILAGSVFADDHGFRLLLLLVPAMAAGLLILIAERSQQLVELIETQAELARLSHTDALTRMSNRRHLHAHFEMMAKRLSKDRRPFGLLMVDVDNFKAFNDRYGHPAGDALLQKLADTLWDDLRDVGGVVARYGGEEFVILLDGAEAPETLTIAERLRHTVETTCRHPVGEDFVTISIGVALGSPGTDPRTLMKDVDEALYRAKRGGRNRVEAANKATPAMSEGKARLHP